MINPEELRIGNFVAYTNIGNDSTPRLPIGTCKVFEIQFNGGNFAPDLKKPFSQQECDFLDWTYIEPIPLTEEWLLRFGFVKYVHNGVTSFDTEYCDPDEKTIEFSIGSFSIIQWGKDTPYFYSKHDLRVEIKWIHRLQNLFFDIKNEELELKN